jgi:hypothetical protein
VVVGLEATNSMAVYTLNVFQEYLEILSDLFALLKGSFLNAFTLIDTFLPGVTLKPEFLILLPGDSGVENAIERLVIHLPLIKLGIE